MCNRRPRPNLLTVLNELDGLQNYHKYIIDIRYTPLLEDYRRRSFFYSLLFHVSRFIVTVGSITVPALLSIQSQGDNIDWLTWSISLAVTVCNGILTLFKIDKKYYMLHTTWHLLESEGWQYTSLSGRYSKARDPHEPNSHIHQFIHFCLAVEKIKMRQIEDEYYKSNDTEKDRHVDHTAVAVNSQNGIVPRSPNLKSPDLANVGQWFNTLLKEAQAQDLMASDQNLSTVSRRFSQEPNTAKPMEQNIIISATEEKNP